MQNARNLWHKTNDLVQGKPIIPGNEQEEVWALKDVSFEIRWGEALGIIGRNGAGKTTLLKILSRITEPSASRVTIKGRVASLLEVLRSTNHVEHGVLVSATDQGDPKFSHLQPEWDYVVRNRGGIQELLKGYRMMARAPFGNV
jgi:ABC-type uncharacterized transport system ATPase subunit